MAIFKKIVDILSFVAVIYVIINLFSALSMLDKISEYSLRPKLDYVSLYSAKKEEYYNKILVARKLFNIKPKINEPFYAVNFNANYYNAEYTPGLKIIIINEKMVIDFSYQELSAVIAHEFAHAEVTEATGLRDLREHWEVDIRAAELTKPEWMESALLKLEDQYLLSKRELAWFESHPIMFKLALHYVGLDYNEFTIRLEHIRQIKQKQ